MAPPDPNPALFDPAFLARLERLRIIARRARGGHGEGDRTGRALGGVIEFAGHRDYVPGDDLRSVDWNVFGRLEKLCVKEFHRDERLTVHLVIDRSTSMLARGKEAFSLRLAASLACISLASRNRVRLWALADGDVADGGGAEGDGGLHTVLAALSSLPRGSGTGLEAALNRFIPQVQPGSLVILLSDFLCDSAYRSPLTRLAGMEAEASLLHILSPSEMTPQHEGRVRLTDAESGEHLDLTVTRETVQAYEALVKSSVSDLRAFCVGRGIRYLFTLTRAPLEDLLFRLLTREGWVRQR